MRWIRHPGRALDAYLDGELSIPASERIGAHLGSCGPCRQRAYVTIRIGRALRAMFEV